MIYVGIDPGEQGAIVAIREHDLSVALAITGDREAGYCPGGEIDVLAVVAALRSLATEGVRRVVVETPFAPRSIGTANALIIGERWGALWAAVLVARVPCERVTPAKWSNAMLGKPPAGGWPPREKKAAAARLVAERLPALQLVPPRSRVPHSGLADAAAIALWSMR